MTEIKIGNAWDQKGRVDPRYYSYDNSRIGSNIEELEGKISIYSKCKTEGGIEISIS